MGKTPNLELRKFVAPEIITGLNASLLIGRYVKHYGAMKPMIVTDKGVRKQPWFNTILENLDDVLNDYIIYDEVTPNPKDYESMKGAELFLSHGCDLIIAIGGGSPMDCAKCISIVSTNGGHILEYEGVDEIRLPGPPLICIPSTSGTSADVSQFAIINDTETLVKKAIISKKVVPDLALIDPGPLMTMDTYLTACTGMDALTHAIEAYVSNAQSPLTDIHALEAIKKVNQYLDAACLEDRTIDTMYQMMIASMTAGLAFSNASLGAVHAMAHSMGGLLDLPHGECNSILLEHVIETNFDACPDRYRAIAIAFGISENTNDMKKALTTAIRSMRERLKIPGFEVVETMNDDIIDQLVSSALHDPCMVTNPKELTHEEVRCIYEKILKGKATI